MPPLAEETKGGRDSCNQGDRERETCLPLEKTEGGRDTSHRRRPVVVGGGRNPQKLSNFQSIDRKFESAKLSGAPSFDGLIELSVRRSKVRNF